LIISLAWASADLEKSTKGKRKCQVVKANLISKRLLKKKKEEEKIAPLGEQPRGAKGNKQKTNGKPTKRQIILKLDGRPSEACFVRP
jgi:hypothetical protein